MIHLPLLFGSLRNGYKAIIKTGYIGLSYFL